MKQKKFYEEAQDKLLDELVKRIESGDACTADLRLMRDYIKDAGIEVFETNTNVVYMGKKFGNPKELADKVQEQ